MRGMNSKRPPVPGIERPDPRLKAQYLLSALAGVVFTCGLATPLVLLGLIPMLIRYYTLRYRFDDEGVGVSWGYFFRHQADLTYDKIQDIHVNRGLLERWLGLGTVDVQTASGSAGAEVSLPGLTEFDAVRDYLYARMRGSDGEDDASPADGHGAAGGEDALSLLRGIRDEVVALKVALAPDVATSVVPASSDPPAGTRIQPRRAEGEGSGA